VWRVGREVYERLVPEGGREESEQATNRRLNPLVLGYTYTKQDV